MLLRMKQMEAQYGLRVANVFHAGDGNLHPLILYDANKPGELERAEKFGHDILRLCVEVGGVLTGEHGVGVEKRDLMDAMFDEVDLDQQQRLKCAFDDDEPAQSRQGVSAIVPLRRTRPHACARRQLALSRSAAVLRTRDDAFIAPRMRGEIAEIVAAAAAARRQPLEIVAGGSKRALGRPVRAEQVLDVSGSRASSITRRAELVLTARPATPLAEIKAAIARAEARCWPSSRRDWRDLLGGEAAADARRRSGLQSFRAAPRARRRRARFHPRLFRRQRARRGRSRPAARW